MEIERKFLVKNLPENFKDYEIMGIQQGYLSLNPEVRIRETFTVGSPTRFQLTVKTEGDLSREEFEINISQEACRELQQSVKGIVITKTRYLMPLAEGITAEIDIYLNPGGLKIVEVEFGSKAVAEAFVPPEWFGEEVTSQEAYKNKNISQSQVHGIKTIDKKPLIVGCKCGKAKVRKEWDDGLGAYYYFYECKPCNYYWEGPIYTG